MMQIGVRWGPIGSRWGPIKSDVVRLGPMGSDWVISHTPLRYVTTVLSVLCTSLCVL